MASIDDEVVRELQVLERGEVPAVELVGHVGAALGLAAPTRVVVFGYLCTAFDLALADVMTALGPWRGFDPDGPLDDAGFDRAFLRLRHPGEEIA